MIDWQDIFIESVTRLEVFFGKGNVPSTLLWKICDYQHTRFSNGCPGVLVVAHMFSSLGEVHEAMPDSEIDYYQDMDQFFRCFYPVSNEPLHYCILLFDIVEDAMVDMEYLCELREKLRSMGSSCLSAEDVQAILESM